MKKLTFKGDSGSTVSRKRKRTTKSAIPEKDAIKKEVEEGWIDADILDDIRGPVMIAFALDYPLSIAVDPRGSVFTLPLECHSETLSSAEPHDVRQVFVASQVAAREEVSFKSGSTGKYLSTDRFGDVKCQVEAISPTEEWKAVKRPDGWAIQGPYDTFLSIQKPKGKANATEYNVRSDVEDIGFCETFKIRIQAQNRSKKTKASVTKDAPLASRKELEDKVGRKLTMEEVDDLRASQKKGELNEAILDLRVKSRSDKFG